jgi:hypothetical protein
MRSASLHRQTNPRRNSCGDPNSPTNPVPYLPTAVCVRYARFQALSEFVDVVRELPGKELKLEMLGVERSGPLGSEAGANRLKAFEGATQLQTLDPNLRDGPVSRREDGPHVRAQCVN